MPPFKIIIVKYDDGYVAHPVGLNGVVGEGDTFESALSDATSAIRFHVGTFGREIIELDESPAREVFVAEVEVAV